MTRPVTVALTARSAALRLPLPGARYHLAAPARWRLRAPGQPPREGEATTAILMLHDLAPDTGYRLEVAGLAPQDFRTTPCAGLVRPEGLLEGAGPEAIGVAQANAELLQRAVDGLPAGGTLALPAGLWRCLPLRLRSDMTLRLEAGAVLAAPLRAPGWPILPARDAAGAMLGSWEGLPAACFAAPLHAIGAERLTIEGPGILDGGGAEGDWWSWPKGTREGARRPRGLHLIGCRDVQLVGFGIRNAPSWTIHPQGCRGLVAAGLQISAPHDSPNTDGFNPEGCTGLVMEGLRFSVGDDCIAIKAGKRGAAAEGDHLVGTRGLRIRHCLMERGHGGLVIGSEMSGGVSDVVLEDCEMRGTDRGLRIKTRRGRGGEVRDITFRRVSLDGVETAFAINAFYHCDADGHDDWVQSRHLAPVGTGTPRVSGITVEDVEIRNLAHAAGCFLGLPEAPVTDIRLNRVSLVSFAPDAVPAPPLMADGIAPMLHEGFCAEWAEIATDDPRLLSATPITLLSAPFSEEPA